MIENVLENNSVTFDVSELERLSPEPKGPGIKFEGWKVLKKEEVLSHSDAFNLGIIIQTRVGQGLFPDNIEEIEDDVEKNGWNYRLPQPAVSRLETPVFGADGKPKYYAVRDGNNRFELKFDEFCCAVISGDEYDLLRYGCMANNPDAWSKKKDSTEEDVKAMIRRGFDMGRIEKTEDAVMNELIENYPKVRSRSRPRFVAEILNSVGQTVAFQPFSKTTIAEHMSTHFDVDFMGQDTDNGVYRVSKGWGRPAENERNAVNLLELIMEHPDLQVQCISHLSIGNGVTEQPNEYNAAALREKHDMYVNSFIRKMAVIVDKWRTGTLKLPSMHWVAQVNSKEKPNQFQ